MWLGKKHYSSLVFFVVMTALAYIPAMRGGFIWDDDDYVINNTALRTTDGLSQIWFDVESTQQYYPLVYTSFWIEYHLWGLRPLGYHAVNVALHVAAAILLWGLLRRLGVPGAWLAAAIFAIHPVHVESVAWITERKNVLSGVFYLLSALMLTRFFGLDTACKPGGGRWHAYALALLFFVCALLSKTVTCSLPAVALLILWWKRDRIQPREIAALLPLFAIGIALGLTTAWIEKHQVGAQGMDWHLSPIERCLLACRALCFYVQKILWPAHLTFIYPRWQISSTVWWQYFYAAVAIAVFAAAWLVRKRIGKGLFVAMAFFAMTLAPALGFIDVFPMKYSFVADHFQYLASIGPIVLIAAALSMCLGNTNESTRRDKSRSRSMHPAYAACCSLIVIVLSVLTWRQGHMYKDLETLWRTTIDRNPNAWMAYNNLGYMLLDRGNVEEAAFYLNGAYRLNSDNPDLLNNLGVLYEIQGQTQKAFEVITRCVKLAPGSSFAHANLAKLLALQSRLDEAEAEFRLALSDRSLRTLTAHPTWRAYLASVLARKGAIEEALSEQRRSLNGTSDPIQACSKLAELLVEQGHVGAAARVYQHCIQQSPSVPLLNDLAWLQATSPNAEVRNGAAALANARQAIELWPNATNSNLLDTLSVACAEAGDFDKAVATATQAIQLAIQEGEDRMTVQIAKHLDAFRQKQPWRDNKQAQAALGLP